MGWNDTQNGSLGRKIWDGIVQTGPQGRNMGGWYGTEWFIGWKMGWHSE